MHVLLSREKIVLKTMLVPEKGEISGQGTLHNEELYICIPVRITGDLDFVHRLVF
jgi:hypothetical protein